MEKIFFEGDYLEKIFLAENGRLKSAKTSRRYCCLKPPADFLL
jgi:hypothetical protein